MSIAPSAPSSRIPEVIGGASSFGRMFHLIGYAIGPL
jgi:hypothetical protein